MKAKRQTIYHFLTAYAERKKIKLSTTYCTIKLQNPLPLFGVKIKRVNEFRKGPNKFMKESFLSSY